MAEPIRVTVTRGETVESVHLVHAVAVRDGAIVAEAGDPELVTFMRSAAKPIQAGPLARAREDLSDRDLAIASASHLADDHQLVAVTSLLAKAPATEDDLECGPFEGSKIRHNCSGKHAGMLALCHAHDWPYDGYRTQDHPCQQAMLAEVEALAETDELATATDGCGVVTFALPLTRIAAAFANVDPRVAGAMRAYPELIRGPQAPDTLLMQSLDGWHAKGGAEGLICAASSDGLAFALKVEDGHPRALRPALGSFLDTLGLDGSLFGPTPLRNSRDEVVGEVKTALRRRLGGAA
jgi:L-asparaginase II